MLLLADSGFPSCELYRDASATGARLLWRVSDSFALPVGRRLDSGTYLSGLRGKRRGERVTERVIEYGVCDDDGVSEVFASMPPPCGASALPPRGNSLAAITPWRFSTPLSDVRTAPAFVWSWLGWAVGNLLGGFVRDRYGSSSVPRPISPFHAVPAPRSRFVRGPDGTRLLGGPCPLSSALEPSCPGLAPVHAGAVRSFSVPPSQLAVCACLKQA
jgi:hypothetical protein